MIMLPANSEKRNHFFNDRADPVHPLPETPAVVKKTFTTGEAMNAKELAEKLTGREYRHEITKGEIEEAKASGLVVAFGASDDLLELCGAVDEEEIDAYQGQTVFFTKAGLLVNECDSIECPHFERMKAAASPLEIAWQDSGKGPCWIFRTAIPHEVFEINDEGEAYCQGVVFALADVPA